MAREPSPEVRALLDAAAAGDAEAVARALQLGIAVDGRDRYRYTPLMRAAKSPATPEQIVATLELLIAAGAELDAREMGGQTALIHAAHARSPHAVRTLLQAGADPLLRSDANRDALSISVHAGELQLAQRLARAELDRGAHQRVLLCLALLEDPASRCAALSSGLRADEADAYGLTPLHGLALAGAPASCVHALLERGAPIDAPDYEGMTPLITAARFGQVGVLEVLLERGADDRLRQATGYGDDALLAATRRGQRACVEVLLARRSATELDATLAHCLRVAAGHQHHALVVYLLERGASVRSSRALTAAASAGNPQLVELLIHAGADPNERHAYPLPPDFEIERRIEECPLAAAVFALAPAVVELLLHAGADPNVGDLEAPPLSLLLESLPSENVALRCAEALLRAGADPSWTDAHGNTAQSFAERAGFTHLAARLERA